MNARLPLVLFCALFTGAAAAAPSEPPAPASATPTVPTPRLVTRDILVPRDYFAPTPSAPEPTAADDAIKARSDIRAYLTSRGAVFPEGGGAILGNDTSRLTVHTTENAVEVVRGILWNSAPPWRPGTTQPPQQPRSPDLIPDPAESQHLSQEVIRRKFQRILIPKLEFRDATLREAIDFLWKKAAALDDDSHGPPHAFIPLVFVGMSAADEYAAKAFIHPPPPPSLPLGIPAPNLDPQPGLPASVPPDTTTTPPLADPAEFGFSVSLTNISLIEALKYVTGLNNAEFGIWPDGIHIRYLHGPVVMVDRDIRIPRDFFTAPRNAEQAAKAKADIRTFLRDMGAALPDQATVILSDDATRLTVQVPRETYPTIAEIFRREPPWSLAVGYSGSHVPGPKTPKIEREPGDDARDATRRKLRSLILPDVSFDGHALNDVIYLLGYDVEKADRHNLQGRRGLPIVADPAAHVGAPGGPDWEVPEPANPTRIIYSAKHVSLGQVIDAIAQQSHLYVHPQPYCVSFGTVAPDRLFAVRTYAVPPAVFSQAPPEWLPNEDPVGRDENRPSYRYIPESHKLVVRDTETKLAATTKQVEAAWRQYYASDEWKKRKGR